MRDKVTRQYPQTSTFEEKGEPKQIRTEVLLLTNLTPYRYAKPVHASSLSRLDSRGILNAEEKPEENVAEAQQCASAKKEFQ